MIRTFWLYLFFELLGNQKTGGLKNFSVRATVTNDHATFKVTKINFRLHSGARFQLQVALTTEMLPCD